MKSIKDLSDRKNNSNSEQESLIIQKALELIPDANNFRFLKITGSSGESPAFDIIYVEFNSKAYSQKSESYCYAMVDNSNSTVEFFDESEQVIIKLFNYLSKTNLSQDQPAIDGFADQLARESFTKFQDATLISLTTPLNQLHRWSMLALVFVAISLALVISGAIGAMFFNTQIGVLTSISSVITSIISTILYKQLQRVEKDVKESRKDIIDQYEKASTLLFIKQPDTTIKKKKPSNNFK